MSYLLQNSNFEDQLVVEGFESLIWTERFSTVGDFELYTAASMAPASVFLEDSYLINTETTRAMILEEYILKTDEQEAAWVTIKGRSLESVLERRIIWGETALSGSLQNSIQRLLNEHAIAPGDGARRIPNLTFKASTDPRITSLEVTTQLLGQNLYSVIEELCKAADIGFKITMPTNGQWVFELYAGEDRSFNQGTNPVILFSPDLDNLGASSYHRSKAQYKTISLVGGEGDGSAKAFALAVLPSGAGTGMSRREIYTDETSLKSKVNDVQMSAAEYTAQLRQKGLENLIEHRILTAFDGQVIMLEGSVYDTDFSMGDILQMENEYGLGTTSRVMEWIRSSTTTGTSNYPTLTSLD